MANGHVARPVVRRIVFIVVLPNKISKIDSHGISKYAIHMWLFDRAFMIFIFTNKWRWGSQKVFGGRGFNLGPFRLSYLDKQHVLWSWNEVQNMFKRIAENNRMIGEQKNDKTAE